MISKLVVIFIQFSMIAQGEDDSQLGMAVAISKAIVGEEQSCSMTVFLEKFYKRNLSEKNKISEVRCSRFNTLLSKAYQHFTEMSKDDLQVLFLSVFCFISKATNFAQDQERLRTLSATCYWIGRIMTLAAGHSEPIAARVVELLDYLLKAKKLTILKLEEYKELLALTTELRKLELNSEEQSRANEVKTDAVVVEDEDLALVLLRNADLGKMFGSLLKNVQDTVALVDLLLLTVKKIPVGPRFDFFFKTICSEPLNTKEYLKGLELALEKGQFDARGKTSLKQIINQVKLDKPISLAKQSPIIVSEMAQLIHKPVKPQVLRQEILSRGTEGSIQDMIHLFENSTDPSYIPLYIIIQHNQPVPKNVLKEFYDLKEVNNRHGIIIALLFTQQRKTIVNQLLRTYSQIKEPTYQQKIYTILLLHFALQPQPNQSQLLTKIMQEVPANALNNSCVFEFLPLQPLQKVKFEKAEKNLIMQLLSTETDTSERMYRIKIDLYSVIGESVPLLVSIENAVKLTSRKTEEMLEAMMGPIDDSLLEILLIKFNSLSDKYTGELSPKLIQWAIKTYYKQLQKYKKLVRDYFSSIGIEDHMNLAYALKAWNTVSKDSISVPVLEPFLKETSAFNITDDNYASFLIHVRSMTKPLQQCSRAENRLQQLQTFISFLDDKCPKKQLKKITQHSSCPQVFLLQALKYYTASNFNYPALLTKLIDCLSTDAQQLEQAEKKAEECEIEFESIELFFDYMLTYAYEQTLGFICKLMKSKSPKDEKLVKRKKGRKREKDQLKDLPSRVIEGFLDNLHIALKGSDRLANLSELIEILQRIIKLKTTDETLAPCLISWTSTFAGLKFKDFDELCHKVSSLKSFWSAAQKILTDKMTLTQIQSQVTLMSQLLARTKQFTNQSRYQQLQFDLLTILQILYGLQHSQQMQIQTVSKIPRHRLHSFPEKYRLRHNSDTLYFYCEVCSKNVCEACASFMHRNHDKNFVTRDKGSCNHETDQQRRPERAGGRYDVEDLEELQKMEMLSMLDRQKLVHMKRVMQEKGMRENFRDRDRIREIEREVREEIVNIYDARRAGQVQVNDDAMEIRSQTEKEIVENMSSLNTDFLEPKFVELPPEGTEGPSNKVSMPLLMNQLMQSIQDDTSKRWGDGQSDYGSSCLEKFNFDQASIQVGMEPITDRYAMLKINAIQGGRLHVASNGKYTVLLTSVPGPTAINVYNEHRLRKCFKKRERTKKFNEPDMDGNFAVEKRVSVNFEIVSVQFCKKNPNLLVICGHKQFKIVNFSTDHKTTYTLSLGPDKQLSMVSWLPDSCTRLAGLISKQIRIYELSSGQNPNSPRFLTKITSPKVIKDFSIFKNEDTAGYNVYICDIDGGVFYEKISAQEAGGVVVSNQVNMAEHQQPDAVSSFVVTGKADLGIVAFREGSNMVCRLSEGKILRSIDLKLATLVLSRGDYSTTLQRIGYVVSNIKELYISKQAAIFACLLKKPRQIAPNSPGNFAIIQISGTNNVNIQFINGNFRTETFEILSYDDQGDSDKFLILIVQTDGSVWLKPYQIRRGLIQHPKCQTLSEDKIQQHNKAILEKNFLSFIGPGGARCVDFKQYSLLPPPNMNDLGDRLQLTFNQFAFVTGVAFRVEAASAVRIEMFDKVYEINAKQPREVQIPFTLKQTLQTFLTQTLIIHSKKKYTIEIYGIPWDKPSVYSEAYKQLIKLHVNNYSFNRKDASNYFNNPGRSDFMNLPQQSVAKLFKDGNLDQSEINFVLKLELLTQALDRNGMSLSVTQIEEFLNKIKRFLFVDRLYVKTSLKRLFRKIFWLYRIVSEGQGRSISLGDPYDYFTFKDLFWVQKKYKDFLNRSTLGTFDRLLTKLNKLKCKRLANLYLMFALFPSMIIRIFEFYYKQLQSCSESHKQRMSDRITIMIKVLSEYYQYNKNRGYTDSQLDTFYFMELLLSGVSKNKEVYKEVILRSFYCFESLPIVETNVEFSYGCRLFSVSSGMGARPALNFENIDEEGSGPIEQFKAQESDEDEMRAQEDESLMPQDSSSLMVQQSIKNSSSIEKQLRQMNPVKDLSQQRSHCSIQLIYYDFIYELVVSLFQIQSRIKRENSCYYIGLLFNLVCLLDARINVYSEEFRKRMVKNLMAAIDARLANGLSPSLFIVLAHFMEPNYDELRKNGKVVDQVAEGRKLKAHIIRYYAQTGTSIEPLKALLLQKVPKSGCKSMTLNEAFFHQIDVQTQIYQIKYLGNLYLNMLLQNLPRNTPAIKEYILKGFVKDRIRVFKNIVILQDWVSELEMMKFTAAFDELKQGEYESGFNRMLTTATKDPVVLLGFMKADHTRLEFLESLLDNPKVERYADTLMQIISLYYNSV